MSSSNANSIETLLKTLLQEVKEMKLAIVELQEDNASSAVNAEKMYKTLNAKFDLFKNLEPQSREIIQQTKNSAARRPTRPVFFKKLFTEDREKYMDVLYTKEDVDEAFEELKGDKKIKKESDLVSKASTIIYNKHLKEGERKNAFDSIYDNLA